MAGGDAVSVVRLGNRILQLALSTAGELALWARVASRREHAAVAHGAR